MRGRYFIYNFIRLILSLWFACLITIECTYCACDKEDWCKGVPADQDCACDEIGLKCLANDRKKCVTLWRKDGTTFGWTGENTEDIFPNYTIPIKTLKEVQQKINKELSGSNGKVIDIISQIVQAKQLISEIDTGIKKRKGSLKHTEKSKQKRTMLSNYDDINNDIRSDILLHVDRKQELYTSILTIIQKISEQRAANKDQASEQDNTKLDKTIKEFYTDAVKELARDINDIGVIDKKINDAYQKNNYDDILEFAEDLKNKLESVLKTKDSVNNIYQKSKSYLEKDKTNVDDIIQTTAEEFCKNASIPNCAKVTKKLLQDPQEYFASIDEMYKHTDESIKSVQNLKKLKLEQENKELEQKKQREQEEKKRHDNTKIQELKSRIANNIAIMQKLERYITDDQVTSIITKGISSEQERKLLENIANDLKEYKNKIAETKGYISKLQKLDKGFEGANLPQKQDEIDKFLVLINKTLQSSTANNTGSGATNNADQDDKLDGLQPAVSPNCNFAAYNSIPQKVKDSSLISFVYGNINFGCSNTCNNPNKSFEICLKIKHPDRCNNCAKITVDDSDFKSIKELYGTAASDKNDMPVLVRESAVNTIQLKSMSNKGLLCLYARTAYGDIPLVCKNTSSDIPQVEKQTNNVCNLHDHSKSRVPFNFSGRAMECIKSTLDGALYGTRTNSEQFALVLKPLSSFQRSMKIVVSLVLVLYITLFGFKAILIVNFITREKFITGVLKIIIVAYLSVGLNPMNKIGKVANGIQDYLLPLFSSITYDLSHLLLTAANATRSDDKPGQSAPLCYFDPDKDYQNSAVGKNYALWDAIDCRLSYYLGYRLAYNYATTNIIPNKSDHTVGIPDNEATQNMQSYLSNGLLNRDSGLDKDDTFLILPVIWKMLLGGEFIIAMVMLAFCFVFVTLIWKLIGIFITNLVNLYVMFYLSPITVPMLLFEQTKSIFNRWLTMTFSFALQPGIAVSFIAVFMILMDSALYKTCEFVRYDYKNNDKQVVSTFELKLPLASTTNIDIYTSPSEVGENAKSICMKSPGYRLMEFYNGKNLYKKSFLFFQALVMNAELEFLQSMVAILVLCIIFYYFFSQVETFAAMLTNGISKIELSMPSLPSLPGIGNRNNKQGAKDKYSREATEGAQDKFNKGTGEAKDKFFTPRTGIATSSNDSISKDAPIHSSTSSTVKIQIGDKEIIYDRNKVQDAQIVEYNKERPIGGQFANDVGTNAFNIQGTIGIKIDGKEFNFNVSEMLNNEDADKVLRLQVGEKKFTYNMNELMQNPINEDVVPGQIDTESKEYITGTVHIKIGNKEFHYGLNELIRDQTQSHARDGVNDSHNRYGNSSSADNNNSISDTDTTSESSSAVEKKINDNNNK